MPQGVSVIKFKTEFTQYLKEVRNLTDGSVNNYLTYIREVPKSLGVEISPENVNSGTTSSLIDRLKIKGVDWGNTQSALRAYAEFAKSITPELLFPNEVSTYKEGMVTKVYVNSYERSGKARDDCIAYHKPICKVCNFDFKKTYGELGKGFIHVHHLKQISEIGEEYEIDPIKDLAPVCPNCHAMLHKRVPPLTIEELKSNICM
jgi:5-methylcytosine-specific restriction protein A